MFMNWYNMDTPYFYYEVKEELMIVEGDIDASNVDQIVFLLQHKKPKIIVMGFLEIDDGPTLAIFVSALRKIMPLTLVEAPQMLAHTIYKIDALGTAKITLKNPRQGP